MRYMTTWNKKKDSRISRYGGNCDPTYDGNRKRVFSFEDYLSPNES